MELKSNALDYLKNITGKSDDNIKIIKDNNKQDLTQEEQKKMNALLNLDFEDYKKQVKKDRIEQDRVDYSKIKFADNYCKPTQNNTFLIIGIVLIIFAIALILLTKSS